MTNTATLSFTDNTLYVEGIVDFNTVVTLRDQGDQWLRTQAPSPCHLDFSRITHCNSAATTLLLSWLRTAKHVDKIATIEQVSPALRSLMDLGGLENLLST